MNTHGTLLKITTFGESHGKSLGVVIDGFPSNFEIDMENIQQELDRRKPGQSNITTSRKEDGEFEIVSGIFEGKTTGHPITMLVHNNDQDSSKYDNLKDIFRPNHADITYHNKYGIRDHRGGGRSSGRETVARVLAGALAKQYLEEKLGLKAYAYTKHVGEFTATNINVDFIEKNKLRTADEEVYPKMIKYVEKLAAAGDSIGGVIECIIQNPPANIGEPVFDKIKARLAGSMLSIGGVLGFEYGAGFDTVNYSGNSYNEGFEPTPNPSLVASKNNNYQGVLGGITTGEDLIFRVAIKPTSSIYKKQKTVNTNGEEVDFQISGRHDPCILPRVIPVIESMCYLDILDLWLIDRAKRE